MAQKKFKINFASSAQKDIESLEIDDAVQLVKDIKSYLETSPLPMGKSRIRRITGFTPPLYRLRSGDFRAYYRIAADAVIVLAITNKKDSEKILKKLKS
ncbi:MAG: type II toxin-antitoxin system RelE/ParE family toxin [Syntrophales bacterium]|nr:type II toxin-antitoxin system RelE/ParE family toxin [Syntrophales bacterium]